MVVALHFERLDLLLERLFVRDSACQSLSTEYTELNLGHVEPAAMFGRVVKLETLENAIGFGGFKCFI